MLYKRPQFVVSGLGFGLAVLVMTGCGGAPTQAAAYPQATQAPAEGSQYDDVMTEAPAATEAPMAEAPSPGDSQAGQPFATQGPGGNGDNPPVDSLPQEHMIIKNGEIALVVENTHTAIDQVTQIAVDNGGYLLTSQAAQDPRGVTNATLTIAVRADQYETALRRLRQIALEVLSENSTGQDVTSEFVDLNSRLTNLEATRDRIAKLLDDAKTVDEALKINQQLADIEGQIEQVKGRMNYLSGRSAFSTITVTLDQKVDYTPTPTPTATLTPTPTSPWSLSPTMQNAANAQLGLVHFLLQAAVWLIFVPGPYLLVAGFGFWGLNFWSKRRRTNDVPPAPPSPGTKE